MELVDAMMQLGLHGWPLVIVICVIAISLTSALHGKWPWER